MTKEEVGLRPVVEEDLAIFFEHQRDQLATAMAAFRSREWEAFVAHWESSLQNERNLLRTIVIGEHVAGNIVSWDAAGERDLGYWIGSEFWGRGIATQAVQAFHLLDTTRPIHARVAVHNAASLRVLEKCGFQRVGEHEVSATEPGGPVREMILRLGFSPD
jgi:RimJ/RimL family protein N-acetyltransferase